LDKDEEEVKVIAAASALSAYAFPEKLPGIRDLIFQKGCLEPLLKLASQGAQPQIPPTDILIKENYQFTMKSAQVTLLLEIT
jgi:hypothetical protein